MAIFRIWNATTPTKFSNFPKSAYVLHIHLNRGKCPCCGKLNKAVIPQEHRAGFGPRFSAMIAEMAGTLADSRRIIQTFCASVLGVHISLGAIQKIIDRVSMAIKPHYEAIGTRARRAAVNHVDETSRGARPVVCYGCGCWATRRAHIS